MEPRTKKMPSDYPQLLFRLSQEDKNEIEGQIEELLELLNEDIGPRQIKFKKGEIAVEALKRGLIELKSEIGTKKYSKKRKG